MQLWLIFLIILTCIDLTQGANPALVSMGNLATFGVLGGTSVSNVGSGTMVYGNVGVTPSNNVNGFPPGNTTYGTVLTTGALLTSACNDLVTAKADAGGRSGAVNIGATWGGLTLAPGVYTSGINNAVDLTGTLTLDANFDVNAAWIFQIGTALTTAGASQVVIINPGQTDFNQVWWNIGSSATLGASSTIVGVIMALTAVTVLDLVNSGPVFAQNAALSLSNNIIKAYYQPSKSPTALPTVQPTTLIPTVIPTQRPSIAPSVAPSVSPTVSPSVVPSVTPSIVPTLTPFVPPTAPPTVTPSITPSQNPTISPSAAPSVNPTIRPSANPTLSPTKTARRGSHCCSKQKDGKMLCQYCNPDKPMCCLVGKGSQSAY